MGLFSKITKGLFGGSKSETSIQQLKNWTPEQEKLFKQLYGLVDVNQPAPSSPGMAVPTTPQEQSYLNWVEGLGKETALQNIISGQPGYEVSPEAAKQYFEQTVRPQYLRELQETTLPQIEEAYAGPSYYGSSRARAVTRAVGDTTNRLNEAYSQLMYNEELARRQALENAYNRVLAGEQFYGGELGQAGQLARAIEQEQVAADLQKFLMGEEVGGSYSPYYNPGVNLALNLLGFQPYTYGTQTKQTGGGLFSGFLGGVGKGLGTWVGSKILKP